MVITLTISKKKSPMFSLKIEKEPPPEVNMREVVGELISSMKVEEAETRRQIRISQARSLER